MAINTKIDICNLAIGLLGNYPDIENIDTPEDGVEATCALWYDVTRQKLLRLLIPNFSMSRRIVSQLSSTPDFGYAYAYEYPNDCLRVLGFGDIDAKDKEFVIESMNNITTIQLDDDLTEGLPLRFIQDVTDVGRFSSEFKILLSKALAVNIAPNLTQDMKKAQIIEASLPSAISEASGINAQENPPIRKSDSKFRQARYAPATRNNQKL